MLNDILTKGQQATPAQPSQQEVQDAWANQAAIDQAAFEQSENLRKDAGNRIVIRLVIWGVVLLLAALGAFAR